MYTHITGGGGRSTAAPKSKQNVGRNPSPAVCTAAVAPTSGGPRRRLPREADLRVNQRRGRGGHGGGALAPFAAAGAPRHAAARPSSVARRVGAASASIFLSSPAVAAPRRRGECTPCSISAIRRDRHRRRARVRRDEAARPCARRAWDDRRSSRRTSCTGRARLRRRAVGRSATSPLRARAAHKVELRWTRRGLGAAAARAGAAADDCRRLVRRDVRRRRGRRDASCRAPRAAPMASSGRASFVDHTRQSNSAECSRTSSAQRSSARRRTLGTRVLTRAASQLAGHPAPVRQRRRTDAAGVLNEWLPAPVDGRAVAETGDDAAYARAMSSGRLRRRRRVSGQPMERRRPRRGGKPVPKVDSEERRG